MVSVVELLAKKKTFNYKFLNPKRWVILESLDLTEKHNLSIRIQRKIDGEIYNSIKRLCTLDHVRGRKVCSRHQTWSNELNYAPLFFFSFFLRETKIFIKAKVQFSYERGHQNWDDPMTLFLCITYNFR